MHLVIHTQLSTHTRPYTQASMDSGQSSMHANMHTNTLRQQGWRLTYVRESSKYIYFPSLYFIIELKNNIRELTTINSQYVYDRIYQVIKPILETWSGQQLSFEGVFGIRRYLRGASMQLHLDRLPTHIISAILQVNLSLNKFISK